MSEPSTTAVAARAALVAASADLAWCRTSPHELDQIIGIHAEATASDPRPIGFRLSNEAIIAELKRRDRKPGSARLDPTVTGVLGAHAGRGAGDSTIDGIDAAAIIVADAAYDLDQAVTRLLDLDPWDQPAAYNRRARLTLAVRSIEHVLPNIVTAIDHRDGVHLDHLVRAQIGEMSSWLKGKAEAIWSGRQGERFTPAEQKTLTGCSNCSPWRKGTIATYAGLCSQCGDFKRNHQCLPTEPIVRRWDYGKGATPAQVMEAKAAQAMQAKATAKRPQRKAS